MVNLSKHWLLVFFMKIKWESNTLRYITVFESYTGVSVKDIEVDNDKIVYILNERDAIRIQRSKDVIENIERRLGKKIVIFSIGNSPIDFCKKRLKPARISSAFLSKKEGKNILIIHTPDKGIVRKKLKKVKQILSKYYDIEDVVVM